MIGDRDAVADACRRYEEIAARYVINDDAATRRRIKESMRGCALVAEVNAMAWLLGEFDTRCRSSRQVIDEKFDELPWVGSIAAQHGIVLPAIAGFTDDEIEVGVQTTEDELTA